jgi:hypothetical protein
LFILLFILLLPANVLELLPLPSAFEVSAPFLFALLRSSSLKPHVQQSLLVFQGQLPLMLELLDFCLVWIF